MTVGNTIHNSESGNNPNIHQLMNKQDVVGVLTMGWRMDICYRCVKSQAQKSHGSMVLYMNTCQEEPIHIGRGQRSDCGEWGGGKRLNGKPKSIH